MPRSPGSPRAACSCSSRCSRWACSSRCYGGLGGHELGFLTARNLSLLSIELASSGVLALGMLLVIVPGHIDLAAGSAVGLTGGIAAMLVIDPAGLVRNLLGLPLRHVDGLSAGVAMLIALLASMAIYALMGTCVRTSACRRSSSRSAVCSRSRGCTGR